MSKHTPGPWTAIVDKGLSPDKGYRMALVATHAKGHRVTAIDCTRSGDSFEQDAANAHLIEAAPDLLAACVAGGRYSNLLKAYQDRGEFGQMIAGNEELDRLFMEWHDLAHAAIAKANGVTNE